MFARIFASAEGLDTHSITQVMLHERVLCNVTPIESVVQDKHGRMAIESGARVDIFDIDRDKLLEVWASIRHELGVHCLWLEAKGFEGCIAHWPEYRQVCATNGVKPLVCSEYDEQTLGDFVSG